MQSYIPGTGVKLNTHSALEHQRHLGLVNPVRTSLLKNMGQCGPKSSTDAQMLCLGSTGSMCENLTRSFETTPAVRVLENMICLISRLKRCLGVSEDQRKHRSTRKSRRSSCNCTALVFVEDLAGGVWMTPEENRGRT